MSSTFRLRDFISLGQAHEDLMTKIFLLPNDCFQKTEGSFVMWKLDFTAVLTGTVKSLSCLVHVWRGQSHTHSFIHSFIHSLTHSLINLFAFQAPKMRMRTTSTDSTEPSPLFEDTSAGPGAAGYGRGQDKGPAGYPAQTLLSDPMSNLAMAYGSSLASQGKEMVDKNVSVDKNVPFYIVKSILLRHLHLLR